MRLPTVALLWEIWARHRWTVATVAGVTIAGRGLHHYGAADSTTLVDLLAMLSFLLVFGIFTYTESSGGRGLGGFPRRLFTLPVSSFHLVAVPMVAAITVVAVLYLAWMEPLSRGGSTSPLFTGVLLASFIVFYQASLWTLERIGVLRLVVVGAIGVIVFGIGLLPAFPPTPPPVWRSESALAALVAALAIAASSIAWNHVRGLRCGGRGPAWSLESLVGGVAEVLPSRRSAFASPDAAQFWFEWRSSGVVLPALVAGLLLLVLAPLSWTLRADGADTLRLLLAALMTPIVLAIPVGIGFSKPTFWSDDLSIPSFVAVRPMAAEALVAAKVRVAAVSVALSWATVLVFLTVWLTTWANLDDLGRVIARVRAFHGQSVAAVYGIAAVVVGSGMFLTWRFLVNRLWSGLYGSRRWFVASVVAVVVIGIAGIASDATRVPGWLLEQPGRLTTAVWIAAVAVIVKYVVAAYAWRHVAPRHLRQYLLMWLAGTMVLGAFAIVLRGALRMDLAGGLDQVQGLLILLALLAVPLARVGFAPTSLSRNRHR